MQNNFVAMIIVVLYMVILLAISWYSTKYLQKKDSASFLFAKKAMSWPLVAMIVSGCAIGGSATLGVAEKAYTHGISAAWWTMAWAFAAVFYGAVLARRVNRSRYETVNQMYGAVYGDKFLTVSVIVQILNMFVVNALQVYAGGAILSSLLPEYFNLSTGIIVSAGVFMVITFIGGLWAAALSNIVNVAVIYVGILFGGIHALSSVGGVDGLTALVRPQRLQPADSCGLVRDHVRKRNAAYGRHAGGGRGEGSQEREDRHNRCRPDNDTARNLLGDIRHSRGKDVP